MSERDEINRRMETLRAGQRREVELRQREAAESRRKQQANAERVREVRRLASSFTIWAAKNKIPTETFSHRQPKKMSFARKWWRDEIMGKATIYKDVEDKRPVWRLASVNWSNNDIDSKVPSSGVSLYVVDKKGSIYREDSTGQVGPLTDSELSGGMEPLKPEHIHQRIAELCVEHGVEWGDTPTPSPSYLNSDGSFNFDRIGRL